MIDVVAELQDVRASLVWPDPSVDVTARALARLQPRRRARWPYVAAAAVVAIGVGVPAAAHLLGTGGVRIIQSDDAVPDDIGRELLLGRPTAVRADAPRPPALGEPEAAFEGRPAGGYTEVWPGPVLLTSFPGTVTTEVIEKRAFGGTTVDQTMVDGSLAYWISAPHAFLYLDDAGNAQEDTVRLSNNALVWTRGGSTYRLESPYGRARALALAESMFD